ncbi:MAG: glycosyl transferase [Pseudoalteromonas sp.]|uniref:glycosyltransferase family 2 protein n=1 Tax=Pseudoalteromonas sp. TaxID=53249 RepID=UPI000C8F6E23|nr:glycosyltransferase family 2 protein [Pseudoalteromonas sp.]MAD02229.1 glycosyl transferase [Pseudoalteromonas sp.]|tara:strand:+ start:89538 stop:90245 length:708 start_codon:yes stop_codon:yes gene_type:complete
MILIVIPAFNEEDTIVDVIKSLVKSGYNKILVVNDASTDNTGLIAEQLGVKVLHLEHNMGAWKATQTGIRYALQNNYKQVVTFDADGQHLVKSLSKLISCQKNDDVDVVIGSCTERGSVLRHVAWGMFRFLSGVEVKDLTSGLRLYNHKAIQVLASEQASLIEYQDVGVLLLLRKAGITKSEVKVQMEKRKVGGSRIFHSWGAVTYYMAYTTVLCLSKIAKTYSFESIDINSESL